MNLKQRHWVSLSRILAFCLLPAILAISACQPAEEPAEPEPPRTTEADDWREDLRERQADNPLLDTYLTPFATPPFHSIEREHFLPALDAAIDDNRAQVEAIVDHPDPASFSNTIEALELAGADLSRIANTLFGLIQVRQEPEWHELARQFSSRLAVHIDFVRTNGALFDRVEAVASDRDRLAEAEQRRLLDETRRSMLGAGAGLTAEDQSRLGAINQELAELATLFRANLHHETQRFELHIEDSDRLAGLPETVIARAARDAIDRGHTEGWVFTLNSHSLFPFLRHSEERALRKTLYQAWQRRARGMRYGQTRDNGDLVRRIVRLRAERAALLDYRHHLDFVLDDSTIGTADRLTQLLDQVQDAARKTADDELEAIEAVMAADGIEDQPQPWDWWYYAERLHELELGLNESDIREWFALEPVRDGAFALANRLWGISFHERGDLPIWDPQVQGFAVRDAEGADLGVLYLDYPHREEKAGGAWMSSYRNQHRSDDDHVGAVVANVTNFPPPAAGRPILLGPDEVQTLFHEFGHALHALLSDVRYRSLSGPQVPADFVEFPALLLQRWALKPEVLRLYAFHYETGALIDDTRIQALQRSQRLLSGLRTLEEVAATRIDLAWHQLQADDDIGLEAMEERVKREMNLPALLSPRHHFNGYESLFAGGRGGHDYRRLWSELLAADAFAAFEQAGLMNRELAVRLRAEILAQGNAREPMASWEAFRGREPDVAHLLNERGLLEDEQ
ncbi:MAG: M3 family metallopeptidase [Wenzhouxiangella sp.]